MGRFRSEVYITEALVIGLHNLEDTSAVDHRGTLIRCNRGGSRGSGTLSRVVDCSAVVGLTYVLQQPQGAIMERPVKQQTFSRMKKEKVHQNSTNASTCCIYIAGNLSDLAATRWETHAEKTHAP